MIEAESLARGFGMPGEHAVEMGVGCVGRPGWQAFAVFSDNEIIASAALFIKGSAAHLPGAATLPAARRRGAQSALIAARAAAAREAGYAWLVGETGAEGPGEHNFSLHNMLRAGMSACYERQNGKWRERHHE